MVGRPVASAGRLPNLVSSQQDQYVHTPAQVGRMHGPLALSDAELAHYLSRLDRVRPLLPDAANLARLHAAHMRKLPFKNLDIMLGRPLSLVLPDLVTKLEYTVSLLSAAVYDGMRYGPDFDHLQLIVRMDNADWIADVGFGDSFRPPLRLGAPAAWQVSAQYAVAPCDGRWVLYKARPDQAAAASGCWPTKQPRGAFRRHAARRPIARAPAGHAPLDSTPRRL